MIGRIQRFNTIGGIEVTSLEDAGHSPLSGYLAGKLRGGDHVVQLEEEWAEKFGVKHAIACNSATSGLMAAAYAVGLGPGSRFVCPAMTMSATAAAPMITGAMPRFFDVDDETFTLDSFEKGHKAVFVTNLFGYPAYLHNIRKMCDADGSFLVEDNAQSPLAMENGKYAGTIGHIGVFSLNVHKPLQCGEGGVIVTDDDVLGYWMRAFINHGEHLSANIGLNLRMPEVCAAIALQQLRRGEEIIGGRIAQAEAILRAIGHITGLRPPVVRKGCRHVYYTIPFLIEEGRADFCATLRDEGVPVVEGYVKPLYRMPAFERFARECPVAEELHDSRLFYIENCAWTFSNEQIEQIGAAFGKAAGA